MIEQQQKEKNSFKLQKFEGPLDLLLFLIQKSEINIYDIPISEITEQYLRYLQYTTKIDLNNLTDFYSMAATLIYIKSKMLLPVEVEFDEDFEDPRRELVERLIEYQKYKKYSELIAEKESELDYIFTRKNTQKTLPFEDESLWEEIDAWDLLKTFSGILSKIAPEKVINMFEEVSVNEKVTLMYELFENSSEISFSDLVVRHNSPLDIICAFLAILEAVKIRIIKIYQNTIFGDIRIAKRDDVNPLYSVLDDFAEGEEL
ncbi:MAG: segregation/condensation protein A [Spirochaetales bacterium]|nr:segregation/condensation protein A [Spirochaetales bacterium]